MKLRILSLVFAFIAIGTTSIIAQMDVKSHTPKSESKVISLEQTEGEFTIQSLTLAPGDYTFEISNNEVDHEIGFVLAPKGKTDADNHIKEAYVTATVPTGEKQTSNIVTLTKGEYVYFCPLNPTPQYTLTVK